MAESSGGGDHSDLAHSLTNQVSFLVKEGRGQEASPLADEAACIFRVLHDGMPDACVRDLAMSLHSQGNYLSLAGQHNKAITAGREAVDDYRQLVSAGNGDVVREKLGVAQMDLGLSLAAAGREQETDLALGEAIDILRRAVQCGAPGSRSHLALGLMNLAAHRAKRNRLDQAAGLAEEAAQIYHSLSNTAPGTYGCRFLQALSFLARLGATDTTTRRDGEH